MYLSSLRKIIEAIGGELEIRAIFPSGLVRINFLDKMTPERRAAIKAGADKLRSEMALLISRGTNPEGMASGLPVIRAKSVERTHSTVSGTHLYFASQVCSRGRQSEPVLSVLSLSLDK
jgi:hypothetical protein